MKTNAMLLTATLLLLSGCATMNDKFGCNQTAGDTCLTIDEVHAMTEDKVTYRKRYVFQGEVMPKAHKQHGATLWIAPHKDKTGALIAERAIALNDSTGGL